MSMQYDWVNKFNGIERDGPFDSIDKAKRHAVHIYNQIANGFSFDIAIVQHGTDIIVDRGHIKNYRWRDGDYVPFKGDPGYESGI